MASATSYLLSGVSAISSSFLGLFSRSDAHPLANDALAHSSQLCASWRAVETARPADMRLISDPLAERLAGPAAMARARAHVEAAGPPRPRIAIRTRYFDGFTEAALDRVRLRVDRMQLVLVGAGMDTRAFRLAAVDAQVRVFEVDAASVISVKEGLLRDAPAELVALRCASLQRVCADVSEPGWDIALENAGFDRALPTVWLLEGLLYYLEEDRVKALLQTVVALSAPGSEACFSAVTILRDGRQGMVGMFKWACPEPEQFVEECGLVTRTVDVLGSPQANYGRWKTDDSSAEAQSCGATIYVQCSV